MGGGTRAGEIGFYIVEKLISSEEIRKIRPGRAAPRWTTAASSAYFRPRRNLPIATSRRTKARRSRSRTWLMAATKVLAMALL